jgi:hypothetical protein
VRAATVATKRTILKDLRSPREALAMFSHNATDYALAVDDGGRPVGGLSVRDARATAERDIGDVAAVAESVPVADPESALDDAMRPLAKGSEWVAVVDDRGAAYRRRRRAQSAPGAHRW